MTELKEKENNGTFYYADFETVQEDDVHYITSFSIVDTQQILVASGSIDYVEGCLLSESLKLIGRFIDICFAIPSKNNTFYFHNFIKFDMFFILNGITRNPKIRIDILSRDKTFYSVTIKDVKNSNEISFRDSMLMLAMSLEKLSEVYCVINKKCKFDHINKYTDYSNPHFIKQLETYCISDSKALSEGFQNFRNEIKKNFQVDSFNNLTASSLALRIFRVRYYNPKITPIYSAGENMDDFIRKSYYGGVVELYKPKLISGYHYDLNALYPSIMKDNEFPIGEGEYIRGPEINLETFYGFIEVDVFSPYNNKPFLVTKDKRGLIAPIGEWKGVYHSEELRYAITLGYEFKLKGGYQFKKAKIFEHFVDDLYKLRISSGKETALGKTLKLIMNSLYGRFGMRLESTKTSIVTHTEFQKINKIYDVETYDEINEQVMISYKDIPNPEKIDNLFFKDELTEEEYKKLKNKRFQNSLNGVSSVMIASAVTALARIKMHKIKALCGDSLFYTDTDSIFTENEFKPEHVSPEEIGKLKLEGIVKEGYFIAPKTYAIVYESGTVELKSKGIHKKHLSLSDYITAVERDSERNIKYRNSFFKNKKKFEIYSRDIKFTFKSNVNKRTKVIRNYKWVDTTPLIIF